MTETRPIQPTTVGAFRFNTDSAKLEYFDGDEYVNITTDSPEANTGGTRGLIMGGGYPNCVNLIEFANIQTTGSFEDFGDLTAPPNRTYNCAFASRTRGFIAGGGSPSPNSPNGKIEFVTIAQKGNGTSFGDLSGNYNECSSVSNATRGVIYAGYPGTINNIEYITMASAGDAVDFGDKTNGAIGNGTMQSPTRGVFSSGEGNANPYAVVNSIVFLTFSTTGNTADFGDAVRAVRYPSATSNAIRGVQCNGGSPNSFTNQIEFITLATLGNAQDFGDLTLSDTGFGSGGMASPTRAVFAVSSQTNVDYVQIMTTGNSVDFGDKTDNGSGGGGCSNGHGGLG